MGNPVCPTGTFRHVEQLLILDWERRQSFHVVVSSGSQFWLMRVFSLQETFEEMLLVQMRHFQMVGMLMRLELGFVCP